MDSFICEACGGTFDKGQSDQEAQAEYEAVFGDYAVANKSVVCDDCYRLFVPGGNPIRELLGPAEDRESSGGH